MSFSWPGSSRAPRSSTSSASRPTRSCSAASRVAAAIEVGAGAQQQGLAGVEPLAAPEHCGQPLLRAQLFGSLLAPRGGASLRVDLARRAEVAVGDLLAAAVADPHRDRPLRRQRLQDGGRRWRPRGRAGPG